MEKLVFKEDAAKGRPVKFHPDREIRVSNGILLLLYWEKNA